MNNEKKSMPYLTFCLSEEIFAVHVSKVLSILEVPKITWVPRAPEYMIGAINLRGSVLPVIDIRLKFGMTPGEISNSSSILVLNICINNEEVQVCALVDAVQDVLELKEEEMLSTPSVGSQYKSAFIEHVVQTNDKFIMILDIDLVFSADNLSLTVQDSSNEQESLA